jgi:eukaryotic-like serine/threonine-protein kinase
MRPSPPAVLAERYAIERRIGEGGMATVYRARDLRHNRDVAVKVLHQELAESLGAERFLREITIAAGLTHPHILPLHDSGEAERQLYYVMPLVTGESLSDRLEHTPRLPVDEALRIVCQVASALDYAHRHHVVHRDIKPANILLLDGHAVLSDFGIARAISSSQQTRLTSTGLSIGTPAYMSPEQAVGESAVDGRSDVYSLACVLYEMLAGDAPFSGGTVAAVIAKRLSSPPPRIRDVRPEVPPAVEAALLCALARDAADRFETAEQFRVALAGCIETGASRRGGLPGPARPRRIAAAALLLVVMALGMWTTMGDGPGGRTATTLAVLPFRSQSSDPAHAYLAEGLSEALADAIRRRGVRVVAGTSAIRYASMGGGGMDMDMGSMGGDSADADGGMMPVGPPKSLEAIAQELRADVLMQGSLVQTGDSVRVSVSLVRPAERRTIWSEALNRHVRDLFSMQEELASAVIRVVGGTGESVGAIREYDPGANDQYVKGLYYQNHWNLPLAIGSFERAVALDPRHAPAQAGLARAYYFRAFFGDIAPGIALGRMRRAATAALEQDPRLAEAHAQLALVKMLQEWDWEGAERDFRQALELSPDDAQIRHDYAHFLLAQGRHVESLAETARAVSLDPVNPMLISCLGWHSLFDRQHDQAIAYASESNTMMPDAWAQVVRGWALMRKGESDSALVALREAVRLGDEAFALAALAHGLAVSGHIVEAQQTLSALLEREEREYVSAYDIATVYAGLGDDDETFKWLRRAAEERATFIVHLAWDDRFERYHADGRYRSLVEREMNLRPPVRVEEGAASAP